MLGEVPRLERRDVDLQPLSAGDISHIRVGFDC